MFLELRTRFREIFQRLPPFDKPSSSYTRKEKLAVLCYWHQTFDEWYVTNHLSQKHMKELWDEFYVPAVLAGMNHQGLRDVLFSMIEEQEGFGEYRRSFGEAMKKLWESRASHSGG